jgi:hypothetical protein
MADEMRSCRKTACRWPAAASLSFRYASKEVWLLDLTAESDPNLYDLCPHHADSLTVPKGWTRVDQRTTQDAPVEPAASDRVHEPPAAKPVAADRAPSRYDGLAAQLPQLAAEWANGAFGGHPRPSGDELVAHPPVPGQLAIPVEAESDEDAVVVSIEMARRPAGA